MLEVELVFRSISREQPKSNITIKNDLSRITLLFLLHCIDNEIRDIIENSCNSIDIED